MKIECVEVDEYRPKELVVRFDCLRDQSLFLNMLGQVINGGSATEEECDLAIRIRTPIQGNE